MKASTAQAHMPCPWEALETGATAWEKFSPAEQESVVRHYAPKIRFLALRLKAKLPHSVELGELISSGTLGLMEALGSFAHGSAYGLKPTPKAASVAPCWTNCAGWTVPALTAAAGARAGQPCKVERARTAGH